MHCPNRFVKAGRALRLNKVPQDIFSVLKATGVVSHARYSSTTSNLPVDNASILLDTALANPSMVHSVVEKVSGPAQIFRLGGSGLVNLLGITALLDLWEESADFFRLALSNEEIRSRMLSESDMALLHHIIIAMKIRAPKELDLPELSPDIERACAKAAHNVEVGATAKLYNIVSLQLDRMGVRIGQRYAQPSTGYTLPLVLLPQRGVSHYVLSIDGPWNSRPNTSHHSLARLLWAANIRSVPGWSVLSITGDETNRVLGGGSGGVYAGLGMVFNATGPQSSHARNMAAAAAATASSSGAAAGFRHHHQQQQQQHALKHSPQFAPYTPPNTPRATTALRGIGPAACGPYGGGVYAQGLRMNPNAVAAEIAAGTPSMDPKLVAQLTPAQLATKYARGTLPWQLAPTNVPATTAASASTARSASSNPVGYMPVSPVYDQEIACTEDLTAARKKVYSLEALLSLLVTYPAYASEK